MVFGSLEIPRVGTESVPVASVPFPLDGGTTWTTALCLSGNFKAETDIKIPGRTLNQSKTHKARLHSPWPPVWSKTCFILSHLRYLQDLMKTLDLSGGMYTYFCV